MWRTSIALAPIPDQDTEANGHDYGFDPPPADIWEGVEPPLAEDLTRADPTMAARKEALAEEMAAAVEEEVGEDWYVEGDLVVAKLARGGKLPLEQTDADVRRMLERADHWHQCPVTRERMFQINEQTQRFYEQQLTNSWGRAYLTGRFGIDLVGHPHFRPGQAPAGWTTLVTHLRRHGVTDEEMLATGVATPPAPVASSTGSATA